MNLEIYIHVFMNLGLLRNTVYAAMYLDVENLRKANDL